MDCYELRYYRATVMFMKIIGQWPYQTIRESRCLLTVVIVMVAVQGLPSALATVKYLDDWDSLLDSFLVISYVGACVVRLISFSWNKNKLSILVDRIRMDWLVWADDREIGVLHKYAERARICAIVYTATIYTIGVFYTTLPIVPTIIDVILRNGSEQKHFSVPVHYYLFDPQEYYYYILVCNYICMTMILTVVITYDVMFMINVQHCCGIFAAVGHKLERLGKDLGSTESEETHPYYLEQKCRVLEQLVYSCIARHNDAIEFAKLIEATYTWTFFITVSFRVLIFCGAALQILMKMNELQKLVRLVSYTLGLIFYVYIESYTAQNLMDHSTNIRQHIQNGEWYKLSLKIQKLLQFMIMRCNVPCQLTAGKIMILSVESFTAFLKTSSSYFTVLRSM